MDPRAEMLDQIRQYDEEAKALKKTPSQIVPELIRQRCGQYLCPLILTDIPDGSHSTKWEAYWKARRKETKRIRCRDPKKTNSFGWDKKKWESKLASGLLNVPHLALLNIPDSIFTFNPALKVIYMHDNEIGGLPENFFEQLPELCWLDIRRNRLKSLPQLRRPHPCLRVLLLQENKLSYLPYSLALAVNLKSINVKGNPMEDPPEDVREQGCMAVMNYLRAQLHSPPPGEDTSLRVERDWDSDGESSTSDFDSQTMLRGAGPRERGEVMDQTRIISAVAGTFQWKSPPRKLSLISSTTSPTRSRSGTNLKYSFELWKDVPFGGLKQSEIVKKSVLEMRTEVLRKMNDQKDQILQRMKNQDALAKWRESSRVMQMELRAEKAEDYKGLVVPFGREGDEEALVAGGDGGVMSVEDFQAEFTHCWDKLNKFTSRPAEMDDVEKALARLREVEEIQRKLFNLKLTMKNPIPY